jgi:outer membrane protein assembly factor BamB
MPLQKKHNRGKWIIQIVILYFLLLLVCSSMAVFELVRTQSTDPPAKAFSSTSRQKVPNSAPSSAGASTPIVSPTLPQLNLPPTDPVSTESTITAPVDPPPGDWTGYLKDAGRSGFNDAEALINPETASNLKRFWTYHAKGAISVQPVAFYGMIYWGSWDGFEHATDLNGKQAWATYLGTTTDNNCVPSSAGVASTATVATVKIGHKLIPVVFVGGGNAQFYALNAYTGNIIWKTWLGASPEHFIWSSPAFYKGNIYIGMASFGDCPTIQGHVIQLNAINGNVKNTFDIVPNGCQGGDIWTSPTIDVDADELYVATGNPDPCWTNEGLSGSLVKLRASNLSYLDSWQVPSAYSMIDSDFGATPTLFTAKLRGVPHAMVGLVHKNGLYYAFDRNAIGKGPVWTAHIAYGGSAPEDGQGSISASAWDGKRLYVAGGHTTIDGNYCVGSVRALNPENGSFLWEYCLTNGPVLAAVTVIPGIVVVEEGPAFDVLNATSGKTLFVYKDANAYSTFDGPATVSNGVLYVGNLDGLLYAFGLIPKQVRKLSS